MVCDKGLTLGDLIGILQLFFSSLGLKKLRFKPAFNPYTEPSMEIFSYSEQLQKWVEVRLLPADPLLAAQLDWGMQNPYEIPDQNVFRRTGDVEFRPDSHTPIILCLVWRQG